jgi:RND family efflux transporter MFP subunit
MDGEPTPSLTSSIKAPDASAPDAKPDAKPDWALTGRERRNRARAAQGLPPRRRWPWVLLVILVLAAAAGWTQRAAITAALSPPATDTATAPDPAPVTRMQVNPAEHATLAPRDLDRRIKVIGTINPARRADLAAETGGLVEAVNVRPGDRVTEGDVLVQVDVERLTLELGQARSNADATRVQLSLAEGQLDRVLQLVDRNVATTSTLEEAQSSVDGLRAQLTALDDVVKLAELALRNATIKAPFDGIVTARAVEPGAVIGAGTTLISLVDLATVELEAAAPVAAGVLLRPGQDVAVRVDGIPDRSFTGTVARINPVATAGTRTIPVYITMDNAEGLLFGGMFATADVVVASAPGAIAMPTDAIRTDAGGAYVLTIVDDTLVRTPVTIADTWEGGLTRITAGLAPGDEVITAALPELDPGDLIDRVAE